MNETSLASRFLMNLGIRPVEQSLVALLFGNMFLSGLAIGIIRVCAFTLFLEHFASEQLALVAILLAVTGTMVTLTIDKATRGFSARGYLYTVLGTVLSGILLVWVLLGSLTSKTMIFLLPLFFEIIYMLFSLQFIALMTRLLNVRQTKRLSGLARSGEFLAEMVGGLSIALLLTFMEVPDLLLVAAVAVLGVFSIVQFTINKFSQKLTIATEYGAVEEEHTHRMIGLLKLPYVQKIALCYAAFMFAYFFLDVAFYKYAAVQYPNNEDLAKFIGQFFAVSGFLTMLTMVFVFAPFLRKFGMLAGIIAFPIFIAVGATSVSLMEFAAMDAGLIFIVMVITNGLRFILQSSIWRPSASILFQVLPSRQRSQGTALIEGIIDPLAGGIAGLCLYFISDYLHWGPDKFLLVLTVLMLGWILIGILIRRQYLSNLMISIQKRKLGMLSVEQLDKQSLDIILKGLSSPYAAEVFYCLNLLEEMEHPLVNPQIQVALKHKNNEVRINILQRIARLNITKLSNEVLSHIQKEQDPDVLGQALRTYAALNPIDVLKVLMPFLKHENLTIKKGALVGLLTFNPRDNQGLDYLLAAVRSDQAEQRVLAAEIMSEIASAGFSGFLVELLEDFNSTVVDKAIIAAGAMQDPRLTNLLVAKLDSPGLRGRAGKALQQFGDAALYDLDNGFTMPNVSRQVKTKIIDIICEIGSEQSQEILLRHIDIKQPELRHQIYVGLANFNFQADRDDSYLFVNMLDEEVRIVTWLLASMENLNQQPGYEQTHRAMGYELDIHRDNMLLLTSFIFNSAVMLNTRANIDSKVSDLRVFALEVLDNLLTTEIKNIVVPLLDDLTVAERLEKLSQRFPQQIMTAEERFADIMEQHFNSAFYWTRSSLLYQIGIYRLPQYLHAIRESLNDAEPLVRETAIWALARLNPDDLHQCLTAHADDSSQDVRNVVQYLLENEPELPEKTL